MRCWKCDFLTTRSVGFYVPLAVSVCSIGPKYVDYCVLAVRASF